MSSKARNESTIMTRPDLATVQGYARIVGASYLAITLFGALGVAWIDGQLVVEGDYATTAANIASSALLFRLGVVSVLVIYASVLVASWALHAILRQVSPGLSLLALLFRAAEAIVGFATMLPSLAVVRLLHAGGVGATLGKAEVAAWVGVMLELRTAALDIVLALIGVGGSIFFVLFWRSRLIPRWLSTWGVFTYVSMLCLSLVSLVHVDHARSAETVLYGLGAAFEGVFALWMVSKGLDAERWRPYAA
jgi:hypothetical protein